MDYFALPGRECPPFPCGTREFDPRAAWWLAEFSRLAYQPKLLVARELEQAGFDRVTFFDSGGTQAYLAHYRGEPEFAVLAFRGTENDFADILTDVSIFPRKTTDERFHAHGGFVQALQDVWGPATSTLPLEELEIDVQWAGPPGIGAALERLRRESGGRVFLCFTGHSLGGALAALAAHRFAPDVVYTFGAPKLAAPDLAQHLNASIDFRVYRVVNGTDVVPHLPPGKRFDHVGRLVHIAGNGSIHVGATAGDWVRGFCLDVFLLVAGVPVTLFVNIVCHRLIGTLIAILIPRPLLRLAARQGPHPFRRIWLEWLKPRLLFMFTNHRISEYSRKLARQAAGERFRRAA